jgi:hypothetical protein
MSDDSLATVDPLPGKRWGARAAAGDALQRTHDEGAFLAIWVGEDGKISWSKANTDGQSLSLFAVIVLELAQSCYREYLR